MNKKDHMEKARHAIRRAISSSEIELVALHRSGSPGTTYCLKEAYLEGLYSALGMVVRASYDEEQNIELFMRDMNEESAKHCLDTVKDHLAEEVREAARRG